MASARETRGSTPQVSFFRAESSGQRVTDGFGSGTEGSTLLIFDSPVAAQEAALADGLIRSMIWWTGIPYVVRSTVDSRNYYGFRAVDPETPIVLIETGCLTNAADQAIIAGNPGLVADALAGPIAAFVLS